MGTGAIWLGLGVLAWGALHSVPASRRVKKIFRWRMGERVVRFYRLGYNALACAPTRWNQKQGGDVWNPRRDKVQA